MKIAAPIRFLSLICLLAFLLQSVTSSGQASSNALPHYLQRTDNDSQQLAAYEKILRNCQNSRPDSAIRYLEQGLAQFTASNFKPGVASLLAHLSILYADQKMPDLAQKTIEKALKIYTGLKDRNGIAACNNVIGVILSRNGDFDGATEHFYKSLKIFEAQKDTVGITNTCIKIGGNFERAGNVGKALEYYNKGLDVIKDQSAEDFVIYLNGNIGDVIKNKKDNFISKKYLRKILDQSKDSSFVETSPLPASNLALVYAKEGDTAKALNYARQALNLSSDGHTPALYEDFSIDKKNVDPSSGFQNTSKLMQTIDIAGIPGIQSKSDKTDMQGRRDVWIGAVSMETETAFNNIPKTGLMDGIDSYGNRLIQNQPRAYASYLPSGLAPYINVDDLGSETGLNRLPTSALGATRNNSDNKISNVTVAPSVNLVREMEIQNVCSLFKWSENLADIGIPGIGVNSAAVTRINSQAVAGINTQGSVGINAKNGTDNIRNEIRVAGSKNTNNIGSENTDISEKSMLKKISSLNLDSVIRVCKKRGDYKTAIALLQQQRKLLDSIASVDSELAYTNTETLSANQNLSSKVQQLESSEQEHLKSKNHTMAFAGFLVAGLLVVSFFWTRTKTLNKELYTREAKLATAGTVKNKLISVIAHDLTGAIGFMPLSLGLCRDKSIPDEEKDMLLNQLELNASSSFETLQNMLDWGKTQIQGITMKQFCLNGNEIFNEVIPFVNISAMAKHVTIINNMSEDVHVLADPNHSKFIFRNLLSNAVKYSKPNGTIQVDAKLSDDLVYVVFSVTDGGVGISESQKKHIFASDTESISGTANEKGNGIGLNLCKDFVTENGGEIWFESEENKGSVFYFSLKNSI